MAQTTHVYREGRMIQIVSPSELKKELKRQGENLSKPRDWSSDDEWDTGSTRRKASKTRGR